MQYAKIDAPDLIMGSQNAGGVEHMLFCRERLWLISFAAVARLTLASRQAIVIAVHRSTENIKE